MDRTALITGERVPHGGESDRSMLDFSANTNPRTPDGVERIYLNALETARRYPDDEYPAFRASAGEYVGCSPHDVIVTPGGLAAIRLTCAFALEPGDTALVPYPSFGEYAREVRLHGAEPHFISHNAIYGVEDALLEACSLAIVCTPNNPTGEVTPVDTLEAFAQRCDSAETTLLVDEAFLGFTDVPSIASVRSESDSGLERTVVARSLTKLFGLPGLRAGFAVATGEHRRALETARRAWCLGTPAAAVGTHCMRDAAFVEETRTRVASERERLTRTLEADGRYTVFPADGPFLLLAVDHVDDLLERTQAAGIAIRDARTFRGLDAHVRVAIKDRAANDQLLEVLCDV